jgi:hypothetical protein
MQPLIDRVRVPVRVALAGDAVREGWLALRSEAEPGRPETLVELLNGGRHVLPFIEPGESVVLLTRLNLEWVATAPGVEANLVSPSHRSITRKQKVELHFMEGATIAGTIQWEAARQHLRVSDVLNGPGDFFPVLTESDVLIVNRLRVRETRLIGMPGL